MEIVTATPFPPAPPLRAAIRANCRIGESEAVVCILAATALPAEMRDLIADRARALVAAVRHERLGKGGMRFCTNMRCPRPRGSRSFASPKLCCGYPMRRRSTG